MLSKIRYPVLKVPEPLKKSVSLKGFTILEMLISMTLLVVGTFATLNMFGIGMIADADIGKAAVALELAQEEMELIKNAGGWDVIDAFATPRTNMGEEFADFDKEVVVSGDPKKVQVIVRWDHRGRDRSVELATLFTNYNY